MILNVPQIRSTLMDTYDNFNCSCTNAFPLFATLDSRIITLDDCDILLHLSQHTLPVLERDNNLILSL